MTSKEKIHDEIIAFEEANDLLQIIQQNLEASGLPTRIKKDFGLRGNRLEVHFHNRVMSVSISPRRYESVDFDDDFKQSQEFRKQRALEKEEIKEIKF